MKNKLFRHVLIVTLIGAGFTAFAQRPSSFRDTRSNYSNTSSSKKIEAVREDYVGKQLDLTPEEADKFWPVYRNYHQEITEIRQLKRQNTLSGNSADQVKKDIYYEEKLVEIKKRYTDMFYKILPAYKVSIIQKSERQFTDELIKQLGERGKGSPDID